MLALVAQVSPEAPIDIAVVSSVVVGAHGRMTGAEVESDLRRAIASRPALRAPRVPSAVRARIAGCGASTECMARDLEQDGYALCLRVAADQRFAPAAFTAQLIDVRSARVVDELVGEAASGEALRVALDERVGALLERSGYARLARVEVEVQPPSASLRLEPPPVSGAEGVYWVTEGSYRVIAEDGERSAVWPVQAVAGRTAALSVDVQPAEAESSSWLWVAIVGVVLAGAATSIGVAAATSGSSGSCVCLAAPGVPCQPCPE